MLFSTYGSNFNQITPHNQNQRGVFNNKWISKGSHFVLAVKKSYQGCPEGTRRIWVQDMSK